MARPIYDLYEDDATLTAQDVDLRDLFPDDLEEQNRAEIQISRDGRYWTGGGAAPLFTIRERRQ